MRRPAHGYRNPRAQSENRRSAEMYGAGVTTEAISFLIEFDREAVFSCIISPDLSWLFEVNRDRVVARLPGVSSWRWRCVSAVACRGCTRCGRACAGLPGCGT